MQYNNKPQGQDNEGMNNNSSEGRRNETGAIPFEQTGSKNISSIPYVMVAVNTQELMTEEIEEEETGQEEEEEASVSEYDQKMQKNKTTKKKRMKTTKWTV